MTDGVELEDLSAVTDLQADDILYLARSPFAKADQHRIPGSVINDRFVLKAGDTMTGALVNQANIRIGTGTTYAPFYLEEGDLYSESGKFYLGGGATVVAKQYGGLLTCRGATPTSTLVYLVNGTYTEATQTIEAVGETFISDGVVAGDFVSFISSSDTDYNWFTGQITGLTEDTLVISIASTGGVAIPDLTNLLFGVFSRPEFLLLDNGVFFFLVGDGAEARIDIKADSGTNERALFIDCVAGEDNYIALDLNVDAGAFGGVDAFAFDFDATAFADASSIATIINVAINNTGATDGDIHAMDVALADTSNTDLSVSAIGTHEGVDVIHQALGEAAALAAGFSYDSGVFTDRTAAFNSGATDVTIFDADDDLIYLASLTKFDEINVALNTVSSHGILPVFEFSKADGSWVAFTPADDTSGFTISATIRFDSTSLTDWGQRTVNEVTGEAGAVDYYWIRIQRTRNNIVTSPIEDTIQVTAVSKTFNWSKAGNINANSLAVLDGITEPDAISGQAIIYVDVADGDLKVKFGDGYVATLATDS